MLKCLPRTFVIVRSYRADRAARQIPPDNNRWKAAFNKFRKKAGVQICGIRDRDDPVDATPLQRIQTPLKIDPIVLEIDQDREVSRRAKVNFDGPKDLRAIGIGDVEDHYAHGLAPVAP